MSRLPPPTVEIGAREGLEETGAGALANPKPAVDMDKDMDMPEVDALDMPGAAPARKPDPPQTEYPLLLPLSTLSERATGSPPNE